MTDITDQCYQRLLVENQELQRAIREEHVATQMLESERKANELLTIEIERLSKQVEELSKRVKELRKQEEILLALEAWGVDNWEGYYGALEDAGLTEDD